MIKPICPHCGGYLMGEDTPETDWTHGQYTDFVFGHCTNCQRHYEWQEVYNLVRVENIVEVHNESGITEYI